MITIKKFYVYEVPLTELPGWLINNQPILIPKLPKHHSWDALNYHEDKNTVIIRVGLKTHNYLKKRKYAKFLREMEDDSLA